MNPAKPRPLMRTKPRSRRTGLSAARRERIKVNMNEEYPGVGEPLSRLAEFFSTHQVNAYLVGGFVRDSLLGLPPGRDIDLAVEADPYRLGRSLADWLGAAFAPLGPAHGVARIVIPGTGDGSAQDGWLDDEAPSKAHGNGWTIDLAPLLGPIGEDLQRRDFTVDAMAVPLADWDTDSICDAVIDPLNGRQDLFSKSIRAIHPDIFRDDPGRLMRAVRLASQLRFRIMPDTVRMILDNAPLIAQVSSERVRDELLHILSLDGAKAFVEALDRLDLLCRIIPELAETKGVEQPRNHHYWDVWGHVIHAVEYAELVTKGHQNSPVYSLSPWTADTESHFSQALSGGHTRRTYLKLAALLHDIAKPQTKTTDETGRIRFLGHSEEGAKVVQCRLSQLRFPSAGVAAVSKMVTHHLRPRGAWHRRREPSPRAVYRYFRDVDDVAMDTLYLWMADYLAARGPELSLEQWGFHARMVAEMLEAGRGPRIAGPMDRLVTGHDLIETFDLKPGPLIGTILDRIDEARGTGEIATRDEGLKLAADVLEDTRREG